MTIVRAEGIDLTADDLARARALFGIEEVRPLSGFENLVYRSTQPAGHVLRITHTSRRSADQVRAEFEFMEHLARAEVPVVRPVRSSRRELVEALETEAGERLLVACMTEAPGAWRGPADWSASEVETYGELMASMHVAAASFPREGDARRRPSWSDPELDVQPEGAGRLDPDLHRCGRELRDEAARDPAGASDLLIHRDAHPGNLHVTEDGRITIFDFDDCAWGTPVQDIAIILFQWVTTLGGDLASDTRRFLSAFLRGYERRSRLPTGWQHGADLFLRYRELELYWLITMDPVEAHSDSDKRFLAGRREQILRGTPYLGAQLARLLRS